MIVHGLSKDVNTVSNVCRVSLEAFMYTIKWVADRIGVAPGTLRAWEQRYGIVRPARTEAGYRLYDEDDLATLTQMARLVSDAIQPAQAAQQILSGARQAAEPGLPDPGSLVEASRAFDAAALEATLDAAFSAASFEFVVDQWLMDALRQVGQAWADGHLDIAQEHFISAGVMRRLAAAFDAAGQPRGSRHVLVGLVPGDTHEIASLAFATMLRRTGLRVTYLGGNLPVVSWVEAVRVTRPDAVVLGALRPEDAAAADDVIRALASAGVPLYVGGHGARPEHALDGTLAQAAETLTRELARA